METLSSSVLLIMEVSIMFGWAVAHFKDYARSSAIASQLCLKLFDPPKTFQLQTHSRSPQRPYRSYVREPGDLGSECAVCFQGF